MFGEHPPIPVSAILAMDVTTKKKTAEEYCRANGVTEDYRLYEGHTRWMTWDEVDSFYWDPERGVASSWQREFVVKGKRPMVSSSPQISPNGASDDGGKRTGFLRGDFKPVRDVGRSSGESFEDDELFVRMDTS